ncbi:MAG: Methylthioribulose-1-phosphate dehydratase [Alphaproteobacteria bacterium MarineAlpha11_Bin1]|nr:MAG: Methylthioribulose-1-phosphate dehydratase [Alphaproteobacteria bacterium MarineAlpha11_Bin1]|tara:strand:+ start:14565 stop:15308 length:744 start_codon:yes stop_codon:yes gene_type:complete
MKEKNSAVETLRIQIAACTRIMNMEGLIDYSGHISARLPDGEGVLIQSFDDPRSTLSPHRILICDTEGNLINGPRGAFPPREVYIHTEILKARPDVNAVGHFHPETATMFTLIENCPLVPVKNHAARWVNGIPSHPDSAHINSPETGRELAETLGECQAVLIRAHGVVLTAESVPALLVDSVHFEENAAALFRASSLGSVTGLSEEEMQTFLSRFNRAAHVGKLMKYYAVRASDAGLVPREWLEELI